MRALILGGGGFLGSHLSHTLVDAGHTVTVFDLPGAACLPFTRRLGVKIISGNFMKPEDTRQAVQDADVIYHLVSTTVPKTSNDNPQYDIQTNLLGFIKLLEQVRELGRRKIVFTSSGGTVYGVPQQVPIKETHPTNPICSYGIHKLAIEKYLHMYHTLYSLDYCILRISNAYGERQPAGGSQGVIATFLDKAVRNEEILIWGDGSVVRDYLYAGDIARALLKAGTVRGEPGVFNIGSGEGHSLNEIIAAIRNITGKELNLRYLSGRAFDVPSNVLDITRARTQLAWEPTTSLHEGIQIIYQGMKP